MTQTLPLIVVYFLATPNDLFCKFNMFPEQVKRVSVMQYEKVNYHRFAASGPLQDRLSLYYGQNKNLFGIEVNQTESKPRLSLIQAEHYIDNEDIVANLRVSTRQTQFSIAESGLDCSEKDCSLTETCGNE